MKIRKRPEPTGEYAVGTFTFTVKDEREEVLEPGTMRSIASRVYYPVLKESVKGLPKTKALSDNMIKGFKSAFMAAPNFRKNPEANLSECYTDAARIPGEKFHAQFRFQPGDLLGERRLAYVADFRRLAGIPAVRDADDIFHDGEIHNVPPFMDSSYHNRGRLSLFVIPRFTKDNWILCTGFHTMKSQTDPLL